MENPYQKSESLILAQIYRKYQHPTHLNNFNLRNVHSWNVQIPESCKTFLRNTFWNVFNSGQNNIIYLPSWDSIMDKSAYRARKWSKAVRKPIISFKCNKYCWTFLQNLITRHCSILIKLIWIWNITHIFRQY